MPIHPAVIKFYSRSHTFWYRLTGGMLGSSLMGTPILLLTTTGRKSGRKITTPLQYVTDGDNVVLIASNAGHDNHPQWWLNLKKNPEAEIQVKRETRRMKAEEAQGAERERLWGRAVEQYSGYAGYQKNTERQIPVVVLKPIA
jgi:deazaflavin-dependent oxidoreductase (nitroreductase family)